MYKHYLYRHIRLDKNEPFYIGVGTVNNIQNHSLIHSSYYSRAHKKRCKNIIWERIASKAEYEVEILLESNDYEYIKNKEIEFIALYGRIDLGTGILSNMTDGGEGLRGKIVSEETKIKRKESYRLSEVGRRSISESMKNRTISEETRKKTSKSLLNKYTKGVKVLINNETFIYSSLTEASRKTGFGTGSITRWCRGQRKSKNGFIWSYIFN